MHNFFEVVGGGRLYSKICIVTELFLFVQVLQKNGIKYKRDVYCFEIVNLGIITSQPPHQRFIEMTYIVGYSH